MKVKVLESVDSTNSWAKREPLSGPTCVIAREQTGGRGRYGNAWLSPKDTNLYLTYAEPLRFSLITYLQASALALQTAVASFGVSAQIKWPNDLLVNTQVVPSSPLETGCGKYATSRCSSTRLKTLPSSQHSYPVSYPHSLKEKRAQPGYYGKKLAGILVEGTEKNKKPWAIVGIGLNVNMTKEMLSSLDRSATSLLLCTLEPLSLQSVQEKVLSELLISLQSTNIEERWKEECSWIVGTTTTVRTSIRKITGTVEKIAPSGELLIRTEKGLIQISQGEIVS